MGPLIVELVDEGLIYFGGALWRGEWVMRISVISADITEKDAKAASQAIVSAWARISASLSEDERSTGLSGR